MKVRELIEVLKSAPQEAELFYPVEEVGGSVLVTGIETVDDSRVYITLED